MESNITHQGSFTLKTKDWARNNRTLLALSLVLVLIVVFTALNSDVFFTWKNFRNILAQTSILAVLAAGTTLLMVAGLIDLSIGTMMSLVGVVAGLLMLSAGSPPLAVIMLVAIALGGFLGMFNGFLAAWSPSHPFVVTLGVMILFRGIAIGLSEGKPLTGLYDNFVSLSRTKVAFDLPIPVWIAFLTLIACAFILNVTVFGRRLYAVGGNPQAARLAGIRVKLLKIIVYTINGLLVGVAALMLSSRIASAQSWMGDGYELQAIAAVAVGGTSLEGGRGGIIGTILGVLLLGVISNSLNILGISGAFQYILQGIVIVVAVMSQRR